MLILAFETSAKAASVALHDGQKLLAQSYQNTGLTHSQTLMVMAQDLLRQCGVTVAQVTHTAVAAGPGSFTGVRIGVAAAKGLAWGAQLPLYGVSTLEAMAQQTALEGAYICACMDARRSQVYNALFQCKDGKTARICPDRAIAIEDLAQELQQLPGPVILVGDGAALVHSRIGAQAKLLLLPEQSRQQRACGVAVVAARQIEAGICADAAALAPNYLRLSQAERERMEKAKNN